MWRDYQRVLAEREHDETDEESVLKIIDDIDDHDLYW